MGRLSNLVVGRGGWNFMAQRTQSGTGVWWQEITRSIKYFSSEGGICILVWSVFLFRWCFLFLKQFWKVLESIVGNLRKYSGPMNQTVGSGLLLKSQLVRHVFKLYSVWGSGWWCCCLSLSGVRKWSSKEKNLQPLLHTCLGSARSWQGSFAASSPAHVSGRGKEEVSKLLRFLAYRLGSWAVLASPDWQGMREQHRSLCAV